MAKTAGAGHDGFSISFEDILVAVVRSHRMFIGFVVAGALAAVALSLARPDEYVASASFMVGGFKPDNVQPAMSLGAVLSGRTQNQTAQIYASLLDSRRVLSEVADDSFRVQGRRFTVAEIYDIEARADSDSIKRLVRGLRDKLAVGVSAIGLTTVELRAPDPDGAEAILATLIRAAEGFHIDMRQSQARSEREFLESRLENATERLRTAEGALTTFLNDNHRFEQSPVLQVEFQRLERDVQHHQRLVTDIASMYEEARVQEVRNTPIVSMLDVPTGSARRQSASVVRWLVFGAAFGALVGLLAVLAFHHLGWRIPSLSTIRVKLRDIARAA